MDASCVSPFSVTDRTLTLTCSLTVVLHLAQRAFLSREYLLVIWAPFLRISHQMPCGTDGDAKRPCGYSFVLTGYILEFVKITCHLLFVIFSIGF